MSPKDNVQLIVSIKKRLIGYFIEARIINQYFLNDISIIYFKRILRKKTIRDLEQGNQLILGNNQIFTNGFIRQEKSSVNLYVNSIELKKYKLSKKLMIGKTMSGQHRIFGKSDQHKLRQSALKKRKKWQCCHLERNTYMCKYCEKQVIKKSNVISNIDGSDNGLIDPPPMFECQINELLKSDFEQNKDYEDYFIEHPASMIVESPKRLNKLMNPDDVESSIYIKIDILYCPFCGRKLGISPKDFLD